MAPVSRLTPVLVRFHGKRSGFPVASRQPHVRGLPRPARLPLGKVVSFVTRGVPLHHQGGAGAHVAGKCLALSLGTITIGSVLGLEMRPAGVAAGQQLQQTARSFRDPFQRGAAPGNGISRRYSRPAMQPAPGAVTNRLRIVGPSIGHHLLPIGSGTFAEHAL